MPTLARLPIRNQLVGLVHLHIKIRQSLAEHIILYHNIFDLSSTVFKIRVNFEREKPKFIAFRNVTDLLF